MKDERPKIEIPDPLGDAINLMKEELAAITKTFSSIMTFVIGVLGIGFLTLLFALASLIINSYQLNSAQKSSIDVVKQVETEMLNLKEEIQVIEKERITTPQTSTPEEQTEKK